MSVRDIIILGTSSQQPTRHRNHGAYLVRWNEEGLLFDPGEGTQRQFIFANVAPTVVNRIFISHFHGDHCLGLPSMLMRLNLDKVTHPIHCYYPASGREYFKRLRYGTIYHEKIHVVEHPVFEEGVVHDDGRFKIEASFLEHGVDTLGWRITETDTRKFDPKKLQELGVKGPLVRELIEQGALILDGRTIHLDEVSHIRPGDVLAVILDTRYCSNAQALANGAKTILCESTYQKEHEALALKHGHMTAEQAATLAKKAGAQQLILTHFSARYTDGRGYLKEARAIFPNTELGQDLKVFPFKR